MIKRKKKVCTSCNTPQFIFSKNRCEQCTRIEDSKPLKRTSIKYKPKPKKEKDSCLENYFKFHITKCTKSEESDIPISNPTTVNCLHLFDKSRHPSLKCDLRNFAHATWEEHSQFDNLLYSHQFERLEKEFPNLWPKACERFKKLLPLCEEETKFKHKIKKYLDVS